MDREYHPIGRGIFVLRAWLVMVTMFMTTNAHVATAYLLSPEMKVIPFYLLAILALVWVKFVDRLSIIIVCSSVIIVGTLLRGCEVILYATDFRLQQRLTGLSLWWFMSGTTLALAVINILAASRMEAEEWVRETTESESGACR